VSLRPAIVIPIFFGVVFGPAVGFFSGFVGNILGDAITGWGVFPIWDIGNGLIGLVAGLSVAFANRKRGLDALVILVGALGVFVPAGGSDLINGLILLPILLVAWKTAQAQTGR